MSRDDRRVHRTREALLGAFATLVIARRYDAIRVADILAEAGVGRSTFYEHFRNKDDLLRASIARPFTLLADAVRPEADADRLAHVLAHFRENRRLARGLLGGDAAPHVRRVLRELVEERLPTGDGPVPRRLLAAQVAAGQIGMLEAWLAGEAPCDARTLAEAIITGARGLTREGGAA